MKNKVIALYLPQFHPFPENDEWWGKGFTEWTNVAKAKPLYRHHYQPKVPADLGFYDLRIPEVREEQAALAREAGVYGFCYWHYWFGNGKRLMERVFDEVLESGRPDFPFCLAWANHSWFAKLWNKDDTSKDKLLMEQTYPEGDAELHYKFLSKAFHDPRYIKVDGAPFLMIYDPLKCPTEYLEKLQQLAREDGFENGLYLVANITQRNSRKEDFTNGIYTSVTYQRISPSYSDNNSSRLRFKIKNQIDTKLLHRPTIIDYSDAIDYLIHSEEDAADDVIPCIMPNWDHTPRSGVKGMVYKNATPQNFAKLVKKGLDTIRNKPDSRKLLLLKSWNEWGEGNYMEPDLKYGHGYINALRQTLEADETES